jgi:hypothetical protein
MTYVPAKSLCLPLTVALLGAACLGGCASSTHVVRQSRPSVTYHFDSDEGLVEATNKAQRYCEQYNAWPEQVGTDVDGDEVTFVCDRDEAYEPEPGWTDRHVEFTFASRHDLVEATERAEGYCARYDAEPTDLHVHVNPDGSRTATFDCEA